MEMLPHHATYFHWMGTLKLRRCVDGTEALYHNGRLLNNAFAFQHSFLPSTLEFQPDGGKLLRPLGNAVDKGFEQNLRCKMKSFIYQGSLFSVFHFRHTSTSILITL